MKKTYSVFAFLLVLGMILAACTPNAETNNPAAAPGSAEPVVLTIGSNADQLGSLDRFAYFGFGGDDTGNLWGDPLVVSDHHQNYQPGLALSWEPSEDYLSWTFTLREGVKFSNGDDFTSADVKLSYERLHQDETLVDVNAWGSFDHVDTPDEHTAVIVLTGIMPTFLDEVGRVPVINSKAFNADPENYFYQPSGTGAFTVTSFDKQTGEAHFQRNDNWWGWTDDNKTNVDEIVYKNILDDTTRASSLQSGDIDIATQLTSDYLDLDSSKYSLQKVNMDTHMHVEFNCAEDKVFTDKNLREALSLSINRQQLVDAILGGLGTASTFAIPEGNLGFSTDYSYAYDLEKAQQLVADSDYAGEEINMILTTSSFPRASEMAQAIQSMAGQAGFNIKIETLEQATFSDRRTTGGFDLTLGSFAATAGDPQVEVAIIIAFDVFHSNYVNEEMHNLAISAQTIADTSEREKVLRQVFEMEMQEYAPFVYLYSPVTLYGMKSSVTNLTVYSDGSANYKFVRKN